MAWSFSLNEIAGSPHTEAFYDEPFAVPAIDWMTDGAKAGFALQMVESSRQTIEIISSRHSEPDSDEFDGYLFRRRFAALQWQGPQPFGQKTAPVQPLINAC